MHFPKHLIAITAAGIALTGCVEESYHTTRVVDTTYYRPSMHTTYYLDKHGRRHERQVIINNHTTHISTGGDSRPAPPLPPPPSPRPQEWSGSIGTGGNSTPPPPEPSHASTGGSDMPPPPEPARVEVNPDTPPPPPPPSDGGSSSSSDAPPPPPPSDSAGTGGSDAPPPPM